jgi:hypothetical protein
MPTYEFRLPDGTIIERSFKISEVPASIPNPDGEGEAVRIISGGAGLLFKGSGFYLTDYGRNAHRTQGDAKPASGGEGKSASSEGGTSSKSEGGAAKSESGSSKSDSSSSSASSGSKSSGSGSSSGGSGASGSSGPAAA